MKVVRRGESAYGPPETAVWKCLGCSSELEITRGDWVAAARLSVEFKRGVIIGCPVCGDLIRSNDRHLIVTPRRGALDRLLDKIVDLGERAASLPAEDYARVLDAVATAHHKMTRAREDADLVARSAAAILNSNRHTGD